MISTQSRWLTHLFLLCCTLGLAQSSAIHTSLKGLDTKYCVVLEADSISGSVQYYNTYDNKAATYAFEADENTIKSSGICHDPLPLVPTGGVDKFDISFVPKDGSTNSNRMTLHLVFPGNNGTFVSREYSLDVQFNKTQNASIERRTYQNDLVNYEIQTTGFGHGFSCSTTDLKLGKDSWIRFKNLRVVADVKWNTDVFPNDTFVFDKCSADSSIIPDGGPSWGLIIGIILLVVLVAAAIGGVLYYVKSGRFH
jgi:hypothetical protein